jgi:exonuclease III
MTMKDFNTPLLPIDTSSSPPQKKIIKETSELKDTLDQINLTDIYRTFHPAAPQYTFFSATHGNLFKIHHILAQNASLNKYKKIKITPLPTV